MPLQADVSSIGRVLSVGDGGERGPAGDVLVNESKTGARTGARPVFLSHDALSREVLQRVQPDVVVGWLFCDSYDAYDLSLLLSVSGFRGRFRAVAGVLPNPAAVTREIRRRFAGLDFGLICPAPLSPEVQRYYDRMASPGVSGTLTPA